MRKNSWLFAIYAIIFVVSTVVAIILTPSKGVAFWVSYILHIIALAGTLLTILYYQSKERTNISARMSVITISMIYLLLEIGLSAFSAWVYTVPIPLFACIHLVMLAIFTVLTISLIKGGQYITQSEEQQLSRRIDKQLLYIRATDILSKSTRVLQGERDSAYRIQIEKMVDVVKNIHPNPPEELRSLAADIENALSCVEAELGNRVDEESSERKKLSDSISLVIELVGKYNLQTKALKR